MKGLTCSRHNHGVKTWIILRVTYWSISLIYRQRSFTKGRCERRADWSEFSVEARRLPWPRLEWGVVNELWSRCCSWLPSWGAGVAELHMQQTHVKYLTSYLPPPPSVFTTRHPEGGREGGISGWVGGLRKRWGRFWGCRKHSLIHTDFQMLL